MTSTEATNTTIEGNKWFIYHSERGLISIFLFAKNECRQRSIVTLEIWSYQHQRLENFFTEGD